jgi:hypothetical protein
VIVYCERARRFFVVQWEAICLRKGWYGFNTGAPWGLLELKMGLILWLLDVEGGAWWLRGWS